MRTTNTFVYEGQLTGWRCDTEVGITVGEIDLFTELAEFLPLPPRCALAVWEAEGPMVRITVEVLEE